MFIRTLFIGVPMGLKNLGDISDVGVHAFDDFASFDVGFGDLCPKGVCVSGVAGIDINSVSGLSSIALYLCEFALPTALFGIA